MTENFFRWRSCDLTGLGVSEAIRRNAAVLNRGTALLTEPSGLPPGEGVGDVAPTLDIGGAEWGDEVPGGSLPPGTYDYKIIPVDTCTGRTGEPIALPSQTITLPGRQRTLRVTFNEKPEQCVGGFIQRDGVLVGKVIPLTTQVLDNVPVVRSPSLDGTFNAGTKSGFHRTSGADLIVGDMVSYQGRGVQVTAVSGNDVTIAPAIELENPVLPAGFFDIGSRTGVYFPSPSTTPVFYGFPTPAPFSFATALVPGVLAFPQLGDVIVYGSKTGLVIGVQPSATLGVFDVAVMPMGLLPIPPLPAGLFWLVFRPFPTPPPPQPYFNGTVNGFTVLGNPPSDTSLKEGSGVVYNGQFMIIDSLTPNGTNTDVTFVDAALGLVSPIGAYVHIPFPTYTDASSTGFTVRGNPPNDSSLHGPPVDPTMEPPASILVFGGGIVQVDGLTPNGSDTDVSFTSTPPPASFVDKGVYFVVPNSLSSLFNQVSIAPTGSYTRLSRVVEITTEDAVWQHVEDGSNQSRTGDVGENATTARTTLDNVFTQAGYPGGLDGLLERLRGPATTTTSRTFNAFLGLLVRPTGLKRLLAVNDLAREGNGTTIDLEAIRGLRTNLCGTFKAVTDLRSTLSTDGLLVNRYENVVVTTPAAACPPGQAPTSSTELRCVAAATSKNKAKTTELLRVFWSDGARFQTGARRKLLSLGLTEDEAASAMSLTTSGRLLSVEEVPNSRALDISDLSDIGTTEQMDEILNEPRISILNTGRITRSQLGVLMRRRGRSGIASRVPGTDPANLSEPGYRPIDDFNITIHRLTSEILQNPLTFDVCDFDAVLAAIPDENVRNAVAGVLALFEAAIEGLITAGSSLQQFMEDAGFQEAMEAIEGIIAAISADPTLSCLIGPINQGFNFALPNIPQVDLALQGLAFPFAARFQLSALFAQAIQTIICAILDGLLKLVGAAGGNVDPAFAQRAIGCIPDLLGLDEIQFPEVQLVIECCLDRLQALLDLISELIAEANEIIDFINSIGSGLIFRSAEATNKMCSGDENIATVFANAVRALGF